MGNLKANIDMYVIETWIEKKKPFYGLLFILLEK
jgi:hypothetical protein